MTKRGMPYIWASWLPRLLSGESQCLYQPWLKAHYRYEKRPDTTFNLAAWTDDHNQLVAQRAETLRGAGWSVTLENQNAWKILGQSAVLAGKCDLVATRDQTTLIVDGKTGQQKDADWWQVLIYMLIWPRVRTTHGIVRGEVFYRDHLIAIEPDELTPSNQMRIWQLVKCLGESSGEPTTPTEHARVSLKN
jgi:hypothetical protein